MIFEALCFLERQKYFRNAHRDSEETEPKPEEAASRKAIAIKAGSE